MTELVVVIARVAAGLVLVAAGVGKLRSRTWPALAVEMGTPRAAVVMLPAFESMLGLALVLQVAVPWTAWVATVLFATFTGVVWLRLRGGSELPCNCFGSGRGVITRITVARNIALVLVAFVGTF